MQYIREKLFMNFPGKIVRKDLTKMMKNGANIPSYVIEYLLGLYCSTDDEVIIENGLKKINDIISNNYPKSGDSELLKYLIRTNGSYNIIDKIVVYFSEYNASYLVDFSNLQMRYTDCCISEDLVKFNTKLLSGGMWCLIKICYNNEKDTNFSKKKKNIVFNSPHHDENDYPYFIENIEPIQMGNFNIYDFIGKRTNFTSSEWLDIILSGVGFEPKHYTRREKFHYLLRIIPFVQNNYNLVEFGPRGTGKSHLYSEINPHSFLLSGGNTTASQLFYNILKQREGLLLQWDCIAFDEVSGLAHKDDFFIQILKNYMANGSFSRGGFSFTATASLVFEGNTFKSLNEMLNKSTLFDPLSPKLALDTAFLDRIHAYLPGWEIQKLRTEFFTNDFALISDCLSEFFHEMRKLDFTTECNKYFKFNSNFNVRDEIAVKRTYAGLCKILYPNKIVNKEESRELLEYSIECRRRVKEQLKRLEPSEFAKVDLGYIDNVTNEEFIVYVPEETYISHFLKENDSPGSVYGIGITNSNIVGVYHLENTAVLGNGKFKIDGIADAEMRANFNSVFTYFSSLNLNAFRLKQDDYDFHLYYDDIQSRGSSDEISVAEFVGLMSSILSKPVLSKLLIYGKMVITGTIIETPIRIIDLFISAIEVDCKVILLPIYYKKQYEELSVELKNKVITKFYSSALEATFISLGIKE